MQSGALAACSAESGDGPEVWLDGDPWIFHVGVCVCVFIAQQCPTLFNPVECSPQGSSVHGFARSGLTFSSPGDLPGPGIEPRYPAFQADSSLYEPPEKPFTQVLAAYGQHPHGCGEGGS